MTASRQNQTVRPVEVWIDGIALLAQEGQRLIDLCDGHVTPLQFSCRAGSCGTCLVQVVEGMENLSRMTSNEEILLPELTDDPNARLACQVRLLGPVRVVPKPPFAV